MRPVLSVTSECVPLVKTGGLADVAGALPAAMEREGWEMRTILPGYPRVMGQLPKMKTVMEEADLIGGPVTEDLIVDTTINHRMQMQGERTIRGAIDGQGGALNVSQGALVSIDGTGAIRALVGGYDYSVSQFDRATTAKRPARNFDRRGQRPSPGPSGHRPYPPRPDRRPNR